MVELEHKNKMEEIARLVSFHRKKSGLTQLALAKLAGIGKASVFDIEHGKTSVQFDTLIKLLNVLNIQIQFESPLMEAFRSWKK